MFIFIVLSLYYHCIFIVFSLYFHFIFTVGGAAILLSNKWTDAFRSLFKLLTVVRTQYVSEDSFGCVYETEDTEKHHGVRLSKDIVKVAGRAMEKNFTTVGGGGY